MRPTRIAVRSTAFALALSTAALVAAAPADACSDGQIAICGGFGCRDCGGHLQPECSDGCDPGHRSYTINVKIDCGFYTQTLTDGCYDERPDCGDCGGNGQIPCPPEAEPWCTAGCDGSLVESPLTGLCGTLYSGLGESCAPDIVECEPGLVCDPLSGFVCVDFAGAGESCASPWVGCEPGLQCTLAFECSHEPAREGETCDATAPCGEGLFCAAGIPQRCERYRRPGEACSAFFPCIEGASCEICLGEDCGESPLMCYVNSNNGLITEQQCRSFYSPVIADATKSKGKAMTWFTGYEVASGDRVAQRAIGVAYGPFGRYGCFDTVCQGVNIDVSAEAFIGFGEYEGYGAVEGTSYVTFIEGQTPFQFVNASYGQVKASLDPLGVEPVIGREWAVAAGIGANPFPISAGVYECDTIVDHLIVLDELGQPVPLDPPEPPPSGLLPNMNFDEDLTGWTCTNGGVCDWQEEDPEASTLSGSGRVTSPPPGGPSIGRLESSCVPVEAGVVYDVSAWLKSTGAATGQATAIWSSSPSCFGGLVRSDTIALVPPDGSWGWYESRLEAPAGAVGLQLKALAGRSHDDVEGTTQIDVAFVPEPSQSLLAGVAVAVLAGLARRARRRAAPPPCRGISAPAGGRGPNRRPVSAPGTSARAGIVSSGDSGGSVSHGPAPSWSHSRAPSAPPSRP